MSENKTLKINPDLFKLHKHKHKNKNKNKTEVKPNVDKEKLQSANKIKRELLKRVKDFQKNQEKNNKLNIFESNTNTNTFENDFEKEFNKSLSFLQKISNDKNKKTYKQNIDKNNNLEINTNIPNELNSNIIYNCTPSYGCLKNGKKPLYSSQTLKNNIKKNVKINTDIEPNIYSNTTSNITVITEPAIESNIIKSDIQTDIQPDIQPDIQTNIKSTILPNLDISINPIIKSDKSNELINNVINNNTLLLDNKNDILQEKTKEIKETPDLHIPKIKRVTKEYTYKLGKKNNRIAVLIKSKDTIKKQNKIISDIKSKNIHDIKEHLRDNNLIKLGSAAPPDVLKKIYESSLLSGNIINTNKDNVIYNYLNN